MYSLESNGDTAQREMVDTLVLESPFNNLREELHFAVFESKGSLGRFCAKFVPVNTILRVSDMQFK